MDLMATILDLIRNELGIRVGDNTDKMIDSLGLFKLFNDSLKIINFEKCLLSEYEKFFDCIRDDVFTDNIVVILEKGQLFGKLMINTEVDVKTSDELSHELHARSILICNENINMKKNSYKKHSDF
jgi:hypothetical protein